MKKIYLLFLCTCFALCSRAQTSGPDLSLDLGIGFSGGTLFYKWHNDYNVSAANNLKPGPCYSIAVKNRIYKNLFLRTELGINANDFEFDMNYTTDDGNTTKWLSARYENTKVYMGFMPELRFAGVVYVNAGIVLTRDLVNRYYYGYDLKDGNLALKPGINNSSIGGTVNFGFNPVIKNIGYFFNFGYTYLPAGDVVIFSPQVGINQVAFKTGITYLLK